MFAMFDESGIFLTACRHGFVLLVCDMIQSGELSVSFYSFFIQSNQIIPDSAKYPLALVDKLLSVYGSKIRCRYDIGCVFQKTVSKSSLGPRAEAQQFRLAVGAFHGHAHNRACQLQWHPLYVKGMGRSEGEGCERIFAASNAIARGTRHASQFHRHQAIEEHFRFWDEDKYACLSEYLPLPSALSLS
jgi:Kyakuja-Dileera-Zisupton transposase